MKTFLLIFAVFIAKPAVFAQKDTVSEKKQRAMNNLPRDFLEERIQNLLGLQVQNFTHIDDKTGEPVSLNDYSGRIRLLYFGDVWHDPCLEHLAALDILMEKYQPEGLVAIAVTNNTRADVESRSRWAGYKFPILVEGAKTIMGDASTGSMIGTPRMLVLSRTEVILAVLPWVGGGDPAKLAAIWAKTVEPILFQN